MRTTHIAVLALVGFSGAITTAWGNNWTKRAGTDPQFARSAAICRAALATQLPPDNATSGERPGSCNSSDLLYGIGRPADPVAARACALREMAQGDNATGGAATLATIYANGAGVGRDDDLAIAYACRIDGAPFEMDGRVKHLAALKAGGPGAKPFDLCDDATSGLLEGYCAERNGALADAKRKAALDSVAAELNTSSRAAFTHLRTAEDRFVKASADGEVDVSGTGRGAFIVASEQSHRDRFLTTLKALLAGKLDDKQPTREADRQLNVTYGKVMALKDVSTFGTVTVDGIKNAQRAWLAYRDAFLAFAATAAPATAREALAAELTRARTKDLDAFLAP